MKRGLSLGLFFIWGVFLATGCSKTDSNVAAQGGKGPDFKAETHQLVDGKNQSATFRLSESYSQKPILLVFWATWCPSCNEEIPELNRLYDKYSGKIMIAAVSVQEEPATVSEFMRKKDIRYPVVYDERGIVSQLYQVDGLPTVVLLAKGGEILYYGYRLPPEEKLSLGS